METTNPRTTAEFHNIKSPNSLSFIPPYSISLTPEHVINPRRNFSCSVLFQCQGPFFLFSSLFFFLSLSLASFEVFAYSPLSPPVTILLHRFRDIKASLSSLSLSLFTLYTFPSSSFLLLFSIPSFFFPPTPHLSSCPSSFVAVLLCSPSRGFPPFVAVPSCPSCRQNRHYFLPDILPPTDTLALIPSFLFSFPLEASCSLLRLLFPLHYVLRFIIIIIIIFIDHEFQFCPSFCLASFACSLICSFFVSCHFLLLYFPLYFPLSSFCSFFIWCHFLLLYFPLPVLHPPLTLFSSSRIVFPYFHQILFVSSFSFLLLRSSLYYYKFFFSLYTSLLM